MTPDIAVRTTDLARRAYTDTVAAAVLAAALRACPDAQDGDLIVDVAPAPQDGHPATVWLSETSIGGLGVIEQLSRYYAEDPRRFWRLVETALTPNDYEYVDTTVTRLLRHVTTAPTGPAAQAMAVLRPAPPQPTPAKHSPTFARRGAHSTDRHATAPWQPCPPDCSGRAAAPPPMPAHWP